MGNSNTKDHDVTTNLYPNLNVYIAYDVKKFKTGKEKNIICNIHRKNIAYNIDNPMISKKELTNSIRIFYNEGVEKIYFVDENVIDDINNKSKIVPLYIIQKGGFMDLKRFDDRILTNPTKNLSNFGIIPSDFIREPEDISVIEIPYYFKNLIDEEDITIRQVINKIYKDHPNYINPNAKYVVFSNIHKDNPLNTIKKHRDLVNEDLGYTFKDLSPNLHKFFMVHETYNFDEISKHGKLCNSGECEKKGFNEKTGIYDFKVKINPRELIPEMPGIYFTHLKIPKDVCPMNLDSSFEVFDRDFSYGDIGIVYTVEYLFKNYHVNLKSDQNFGYGKKIDINSYFRLMGDEAIVRANTIPLKDIECILLNLRYHELRFIYDNLGYDTDFKLKDVIKLYKENINNKWYIRKSNLTKLIKFYKKDFPLLYISKTYLDPFEYENYGTQFDTDSDREMLD